MLLQMGWHAACHYGRWGIGYRDPKPSEAGRTVEVFVLEDELQLIKTFFIPIIYFIHELADQKKPQSADLALMQRLGRIGFFDQQRVERLPVIHYIDAYGFIVPTSPDVDVNQVFHFIFVAIQNDVGQDLVQNQPDRVDNLSGQRLLSAKCFDCISGLTDQSFLLGSFTLIDFALVACYRIIDRA